MNQSEALLKGQVSTYTRIFPSTEGDLKIIMTLLVRDEEDIIKQNIEYHLSRGVSHFIATDNRSIDGTTDILREYEQAGLLELILEESDNYAQHKWVTRMARQAAELGADWVINNDADEFWWPDAATFQDVLAGVQKTSFAVSVERTNFLPRTNEAGHSLQRMTIREVASKNSLGHPLPPKVLHRGSANVQVSQGNHSVTEPGGVKVLKCPALEILHFPLRSYAQFENKIVKGGEAYRRNTELPSGVGQTWRRLYEKYEMGALRSYYDEQALSSAMIADGLANGSLVEDRRLINYLEANNLL